MLIAIKKAKLLNKSSGKLSVSIGKIYNFSGHLIHWQFTDWQRWERKKKERKKREWEDKLKFKMFHYAHNMVWLINKFRKQYSIQSSLTKRNMWALCCFVMYYFFKFHIWSVKNYIWFFKIVVNVMLLKWTKCQNICLSLYSIVKKYHCTFLKTISDHSYLMKIMIQVLLMMAVLD